MKKVLALNLYIRTNVFVFERRLMEKVWSMTIGQNKLWNHLTSGKSAPNCKCSKCSNLPVPLIVAGLSQFF